MSILEWNRADTNTLKTVANLAAEFEHTPGFQNPEDSIWKYGQRTIDLSYELGSTLYMGKAYGRMCMSLAKEGKYDQGLAFADSAIKYLGIYDSNWAIMSITHFKGMMYLEKNQFDQALSSFQEAYQKAVVLDDTMAIGVMLDATGHVHEAMENYELALADFEKGVAFLADTKHEFRYAMGLSNVGTAYHQLKNYEKAIRIFDQGIPIMEKLGSEEWTIMLKSNKATSLSALGRHEEAIPIAEEQVRYFRDENDNKQRYATALGMLGDMLVRAGQHKKAISPFEESLTLYQELGVGYEQKMVHEKLAEIFEALRGFDEGFFHLKEAKILGDSLLNQETNDKIQELTQQFEAEKKEAAISQLETKTQLQQAQISADRTTKTGLGGGIILLGIIGFLAWNSQRKALQNERVLTAKNEEIKATEFKRNLTELELKALRAQMNPHFIFNCMNSINRLILEDKNEQAARNLTKFSRLIRQILEHSEKKAISLKEELDMLQTYIELEAQRFKGQIAYEFKIDPNLDTEDIELPSMVLQPFIENAIWHGLMHKESDDKKLLISIEEKGDTLHCIIEDNGVGREKALELKSKSSIQHKSMAMKVTSDRLRLLAKEGMEKLVHIVDLKDELNRALGTRVEVSIPL